MVKRLLPILRIVVKLTNVTGEFLHDLAILNIAALKSLQGESNLFDLCRLTLLKDLDKNIYLGLK